MITITVYGSPAAQGSKRFIRHASDGRGIMIESSKKTKPWREAVKAQALTARAGAPPIDEGVIVRMVFTFLRPRGHYRSGKNAHLLRDTAPWAPIGKPDLSKLARATEDALTDAGIWRDDSRVVAYEKLAKVWALEDPDALDAPGVVIEIRRRGEQRG